MTPLEKKINHILLDDDISDISSKEEMVKYGVKIVSNSEMLNFIRDCEGFNPL